MFALLEMRAGWVVVHGVFSSSEVPQIKIEPVSFKSEKDTCIPIVCREGLLADSECEILPLNREQFLKPNSFSVLQMDFLAETSRWSYSTLPA